MTTLLFVGKKNDAHTKRALDFCRAHFEVTAILGDYSEEMSYWKGDYLISYLARDVFPKHIIENVGLAINFHPGPPEYPGIGCVNFALYDEAEFYGVTCHKMASKVDTGPIISVVRFPIFSSDTVESLLRRTYDYQLSLFYEVMSTIIIGRDLPSSHECWTRKPFTRKELNNLCRITTDMSECEIARRIRATAFDTWKPIVEVNGYIFELKQY